MKRNDRIPSTISYLFFIYTFVFRTIDDLCFELTRAEVGIWRWAKKFAFNCKNGKGPAKAIERNMKRYSESIRKKMKCTI